MFFYSANEIKPKGWLLRQLQLEANGLVGNLDKIWPDVSDSAWIGGSREGWERVPYWLDGFIPLAALLDDDDLKNRAKKYIDAILERQQPDGWICPCNEAERATYDTWAVQLISKVLTVYYECFGDERIPNALYKVMKNYYDLLSEGKIVLKDWGKYRWFEAFIALNFLWKRNHESWIKSLAKILREQGHDYEKESDTWIRPLNEWHFGTHIVNIGMMLKCEAISHELLDEEINGKADRMYSILKKFNGTVTGLFTGDECLSGLSAVQGTELCSVVEQMYSYEILYAATGDTKWAELLEEAAFNALPATISDDMWTHQYDQLSNQIACIKFNNVGKPIFRTNGRESHLFGLEPNFGCCTANMGQGWPKFALTAFLHDDNAIENSLFVPCTLDANGTHIEIETDYPFKNSVKYLIMTETDFTFRIRIPSFAEKIAINGKSVAKEKFLSFDIRSGEKTEIILTFDVKPTFVNRPHELSSIKYGSLVFSLPINYTEKMYEYTKDGVERKFPYCDYELIPESDWSFGIEECNLTVESHQVSEIPFSSKHPPLTIKVKLSPIDWGYYDGYTTVCDKTPQSKERIGATVEKDFVPYGCAKLRMTELPILK